MSGIVAQVKRAIFIAAVGLAAGALMGSPASAEVTYTYGLGGPGGGLFDEPCNGNDVLVGFEYYAGKAMDEIGPVCQPVQNGYIVGQQYILHYHGGPGGNHYPGVRCPPNEAIISLQVYWDDNGDVHHVRARCDAIVGNVGGVILAPTKTSGGIATQHGTTACPNGAFAIGITGFSGALIDKLGLKCNTFEVADTAPVNTAPPADNTPPPPPADNTPPPQNNTPDASTRTAATATTIYDQPEGNDVAYLDEGDFVTIVSCEDGGQGWCRISKPKKGYVWGGDLGP